MPFDRILEKLPSTRLDSYTTIASRLITFVRCFNNAHLYLVVIHPGYGMVNKFLVGWFDGVEIGDQLSQGRVNKKKLVCLPDTCSTSLLSG